MDGNVEELTETRKALLNILEDVEEARQKAEEERDKTKAIVSNLADGLLVLDGENKIILINSRGEKILALKAEEIEGKILGSFSEISSLKKLAEMTSRRKNLFRGELSLEKPNKIVLEVTIIPLTPRQEKIVILHDISREKLIDQMKSEFVSFSAHQLKTPLSTIKWALRILLDGDLGKLLKKQKEVIAKTYQTNERMIFLIEDLLSLARIEEGRYVFSPTFVQIEEIIQSVMNSYQEKIKEKKIDLQFKKPKEKLPQVKVDAEKIKLAIENFIENAIKYASVGGQVIVILSSDKKAIEFSVKDNGIGIPKDQQEKIFTKFFRAANATKLENEGTGLGLFITKNIIEAHGGKIWFESDEERGTNFHFTIPL